MLGSDVSWALGGEQAAHALLVGGPVSRSEGWLCDPQSALLQPPAHGPALTVPVLVLQVLVLLLYWYSGRTSVDAFVVRLLLNHH